MSLFYDPRLREMVSEGVRLARRFDAPVDDADPVVFTTVVTAIDDDTGEVTCEPKPRL